MLFYAPEFLAGFLPVTLVVYLALGGAARWRVPVIVASSLAFYAYWGWRDTGILLASVAFNCGVCRLLWAPRVARRWRRAVMVVGVCGNLAVLGYFKYYHWVLSQVGLGSVVPAGVAFSTTSYAIPLGISFFTFQQISLVVDTYRNPVRYTLGEVLAYVTYFAQLIAGPIVRHTDLIPQFRETKPAGLNLLRFLVGLVFFWVGYSKKIYLADNLAVYANWGFDRVAMAPIGAHEAWLAVLSYTLQLYFDFSGYADMAIGLGLFFGFVLPVNFDSPYKAATPADFWRRWHITLSRFLRDYLFLPISYWLSRRIHSTHWIAIRTDEWIYAAAILVTMTLGGLWHGAAWTFVVWGSYHGAWLVVFHFWRRGRRRTPWSWLSVPTTFLVTSVGWVFFRAADLRTAARMLGSMTAFPRPQDTPDSFAAIWRTAVDSGPRLLSPYWDAGVTEIRAAAFVLVGLVIVFFLPNLNALLRRVDRVPTLLTRPAVAYATIATLCVAIPVLFGVVPVVADLYANALAPAQFIYFNF